ncbi:MAG: hypothetical protein ABSH50_08670 [Bryobacteraceae bacterium]|jgi:hypothetical protein
MKPVLGTLLFISVIPAYGSMIVVSGVTLLSNPPASVQVGQMLSNTTIYGFSEQTDLTLLSPVNVGIMEPGTWPCCSGLPSGIIPAGITVNSYLLRAAPVSNTKCVSGTCYTDFVGEITFSPGEKILGIILGYSNLAATDQTLGFPGTQYPPAGYQNGGLQTGDEVILSGNMETLVVDFRVTAGNSNMIRILTESPEPAAFVLLGSGLLLLAGCRRFSSVHRGRSSD